MRTPMRQAIRRAVQKVLANHPSRPSCAVVEGLESRALMTGTHYVPLTIPHDYSVDVTEELEDFFATVDPGSTIVFPELAYDSDTVGYKIEGTLSILNMEDVVFEGNGAHLRAFVQNVPDARNRRHVSINATNDGVTLQNFTIIGADPTPGTFSVAYEAQHGLALGGHNILIDNVDISSVAGDFVYFGAGCSNITVQNSFFDGAGRQGVAPCNGSDILIQNNTITNVGRHLLDFEPDGTWYAKNVRVIGNTLGKSGMSVLVASGGPFVNNILLANNEVIGPNGFQYTLNESGGTVNRRQNWALINNSTFHFRNTDYDIGMRFSNTNGVIVAGNTEKFGTYPNTTQFHGVSLNNVVGAIVADNRWIDATYSIKNMNSSEIWNSNDLIVTTPNNPSNWESSTTLTELSIPGTYGIVIPYDGVYEGQTITGGHMYVISRYTDNMGTLTFNGLTSTDRTAAVIVDSNGDFVTGWRMGEAGAASYDGTPLEELHEVPVVVEHPTSQYGAVGQTVPFTVVPDGDDPLSFQWQRNGVDIPGATRSEYLHTIQSNDNGVSITCIVSSPWGAPKTSNVATLYVVTAAAPTLVTQPSNFSVAAGLTATFTVSAAGSQGPLTYQWKRNGVNIAGATSASYTIATVVGDNGAQFTCAVTNPTGSTTSSAATLTVASPTLTESWTGTNGAAWPGTWNLTGSGNLNIDIYNNMGRVQHINNSGTSGRVALQNTLNTINSDQTITYRFEHANGGFGLVGRAADSTPTTHYSTYQSIGASPQRLYLHKTVSGTETSLGYVALPVTTGVLYKIRFQIQQNGDTTELRAKVWAAADPEPDNWAIERTDSTAALQNLSGRLGMRFAVPHSKVVSVDDYVGTALSSSPAPDAPDSLDAVAISSRHVRLGWADVGGELGYKLERSTDGTTWAEVATIAADKTSYTDATVSPNTLYYYRMWAYNLYGVSEYVEADSLTTPAESATPASPTAPQASATSGSEATVTWTDSSTTEFGFRIERSLDGTTGWQQAGLASAGATVFYDQGLTLGTTYYYRVVAYNNTGSSSPTSVVNTTTQSDTFSESFTGYTGSAWPSQWTREGGTGSVIISGNRGQHVYASGGKAVNYINNANAENINQMASYLISPDNAYAGLIARRTDADSDTYYFARLENDNATSRVYLYKSVDGVETSLAQTNNFNWLNSSTAIYHLRFNVQTNGAATTLQAKVWLSTDPEPTAWSVAFNDSTAVLQGRSGRFGIFTGVSSGRTVAVDNWWAGPATLGAPSDLLVSKTAPTQIDLSWTDNSSNEAGFVIERSSNGSSGWAQVGTALANRPTFRDTGLTTGATYYYRVRAYHTGVTSANSNMAIAIAQAQLADNWTGTNGAAWPANWSFTGSGNLDFDINSNKGRIRHVTNSGTNDRVAVQNTLNTIDSDQTVTFSFDTANGAMGLVARAADANDDTYYYTYQSIDTNPDRLYLFKMEDNVATSLGYVSVSAAQVGESYKLRFVVEQNGASTTLKARLWLASGTEPSTWTISTSDSTAALQDVSGRAGLKVTVPYNHAISVDDYSSVPEGSPTVSIVATDAKAIEAGANKGTFTVTRSNTLGGDLEVAYTIGGSASSGDYSEVLTGTVIIPAGQFSTTIDITPVDDLVREADETLMLTLTSGGEYVLSSQDEDTVTIRNVPEAADDFETGNGTGGSGWANNWTFTGGANAAVQASNAKSGGYSLRLMSTGTATRTVDLSEGSGSRLSYWWKANSFDSVNDDAFVYIYDGTTWIEVAHYVDGQDDNAYHYEDIDLSPYNLTSNFQVRFTSSTGASGDYFYVDDVVVS